jgi:hypothetical protein
MADRWNHGQGLHRTGGRRGGHSFGGLKSIFVPAPAEDAKGRNWGNRETGRQVGLSTHSNAGIDRARVLVYIDG